MIRIQLDEEIHDADGELITDFAHALIDRDAHLMGEVIYTAKQRIERRCRCYEVTCICEK
tara:strand:- start:2022 stop:2201 length:180 start_codon:yes stop_codon:yes gene_type:complete